MNIGLKFRDAMGGGVGHVVREELDQLVASIVQHWLVGHNVDGSHSNAIGANPGDPTGTKYLRDDMVWNEILALQATDSPTITGTWTFSTLPVLGSLTGFLYATGGAIGAATTIEAQYISDIAALTLESTPAAGDFLILERAGVPYKVDASTLGGGGGSGISQAVALNLMSWGGL